MIFTINGELTDLNTYINAERTNRFIASKIKKRETQKVWAYAMEMRQKLIRLGMYGAPMKKIVLSICWYLPNEKKDPDNIAFAKKFILDGLVEAEILKNDGWKQVAGFTDTFFVDKENPRIEIDLI